MLCLVPQSSPTISTPWTVALQAPLSMGFSRQYWSGLPFPSSRGSSQPRKWTEVSHFAGGFFIDWATTEAIHSLIQWKPAFADNLLYICTKLSTQRWISKAVWCFQAGQKSKHVGKRILYRDLLHNLTCMHSDLGWLLRLLRSGKASPLICPEGSRRWRWKRLYSQKEHHLNAQSTEEQGCVVSQEREAKLWS